MKVGVLANCQGWSIAACMRAMNPSLEVDQIEFNPTEHDAEYVKQKFDSCELIFAQRFVKSLVPPDCVNRIFYFPSIAYNGFHPDMTYVRGRRKTGEFATVMGPMYSYNSVIAVFGYKLGIPLDKLIGFYNSSVFSRLGYFDAHRTAVVELLAEGDEVAMPLGAMINSWRRGGCFMYSFNHPELRAVADVVRALFARAKVEIVHQNVDKYTADPLRGMPIWPIYPELAERCDLHGDYSFKISQAHPTFDLREFLSQSFSTFDEFDRDSLEALNYSYDQFRSKLNFITTEENSKFELKGNPYRDLPKTQFWRNSVAQVRPDTLDPVVGPRFTIGQTEKIATAGSCFAQHIARTLSRSGFNYFVPESAGADMPLDEAATRNYGVYSARYGNIYTTRQLLQLIKRVEGVFQPEEAAWIKNGRLVDPFRPQIEPDGFLDSATLRLSQHEHFAAVRRMLREMNVFVFTLGLTESWRSKHDGAVFPLAPGVAGGEMDSNRYEFVNFTIEEVSRDLDEVIDLLKVINPRCRIIFTVSPVPLIATYEPRHALVSTTYSKSVLRAAAEHAIRNNAHVEYFPSYEIITGAYNRGAYYDEDLRTVKEEGVAHVMRVFMRHYARSGEAKDEALNAPRAIAPHKPSALFEIVCDEEAIANFNRA